MGAGRWHPEVMSNESDPTPAPTTAKERQQREREAGRSLTALTDDAVTEALRLAPEVADAADRAASERCLPVVFTTVDHAAFARKRINEALAVAEYGDEIDVWVWDATRHQRAPLSEGGAAHGVEVRMERRD